MHAIERCVTRTISNGRDTKLLNRAMMNAQKTETILFIIPGTTLRRKWNFL